MKIIARTLGIVAFSLAACAAQAADITVFAAASLKTALDQAAADWQAKTGNTVTISYAGTPQLAKQIEQGAPADLFLSASEKWMDTLADDQLIDPNTRVDLWGNTLVLVAGDAAAAPLTLNKTTDLAGLLAGGKLAMALVDSVPAGQYGKEALQTLGLWTAVEPSVAQAENVRAALALVATGEAPYGIVYGSDAMAEPAVHVVATFPDDSHKPITYPGAVTTTAKPEAADFLTYLATTAAPTFTAQGFTVLQR
jgi:molybdate transport system substrate-binding protein